MRRITSVLMTITLGAAALVAGCATPSSGAAAPVVVVAHLDIARASLDGALGLLRTYADTSRKEAGNTQLEVLRQPNGNHFTLIEGWSSRAAYEAHVAGAAARDFHRQLDPLLGSPHDERIYRQVE